MCLLLFYIFGILLVIKSKAGKLTCIKHYFVGQMICHIKIYIRNLQKQNGSLYLIFEHSGLANAMGTCMNVIIYTKFYSDATYNIFTVDKTV